MTIRGLKSVSASEDVIGDLPESPAPTALESFVRYLLATRSVVRGRVIHYNYSTALFEHRASVSAHSLLFLQHRSAPQNLTTLVLLNSRLHSVY